MAFLKQALDMLGEMALNFLETVMFGPSQLIE